MEELLKKFQDMLDRDANALSRSEYRDLLEECKDECRSRLDALDSDDEAEED
jgi:hypothetical protein